MVRTQRHAATDSKHADHAVTVVHGAPLHRLSERSEALRFVRP